MTRDAATLAASRTTGSAGRPVATPDLAWRQPGKQKVNKEETP
jgi:hypothetical protein